MGLTKPTVGIIGGTGRMGTRFANLFKRHGLRVLCAGRKTGITPSTVAQQSDVVVVSVSIPGAKEGLRPCRVAEMRLTV